MKKRLLALALLCAFLLSACSMLERSYVASTPHVPFSDEDNDPSILRAETYQGLVSALLHLVGQGEETGVIRLYQFVSITGSAASDVDRACLEVTQKDPLGAWAVDYIKYDVTQTSSYYQVDVKVAYTKTPEEISRIISVTGSSAVARELRDLLPALPGEAVFRISYFSQEDSAETLEQAVRETYDHLEEPRPSLLDVTVTLYPNSGQQRVAEIRMTWGDPVLPGAEIF